jgi:hypothetical protein
MNLDPLRRRLERCRAALPESLPWPPEPGSLDWCSWLEIGRPVARVGSVAMLEEVAKKAWSGVSEATALDIEEAIC